VFPVAFLLPGVVLKFRRYHATCFRELVDAFCQPAKISYMSLPFLAAPQGSRANIVDYVNAERSLLKSTGRCEDRTVQGGRKRLLDEIRSWYGEELNKIDMTLDRLHDSSTLGERQLK